MDIPKSPRSEAIDIPIAKSGFTNAPWSSSSETIDVPKPIHRETTNIPRSRSGAIDTGDLKINPLIN